MSETGRISNRFFCKEKKGIGFDLSIALFPNYRWFNNIINIKFALKIGNKNDFILLLNNDVKLSSNALLNLVNVLIKFNRKAIAGALSVNFNDKKTIIKSGTVVKSWFWNSTNHLYKGQNINNIKIKKIKNSQVLLNQN